MQLDRSTTPIIYVIRSSNQIHTCIRRRRTQDDLGSCGWEIAIGCEILWQCKRLTFGLKAGSFRAESYGFFSALLFLQAYTEYYSITIETDTLHDFLCDSESLLKRIQRAITRSWVNPSHCLASDYDLLESGIVDIIATIGISFNYLHVKNHQDDDTDIHLLPWTAQMNIVHVDTLATDSAATQNHQKSSLSFQPTKPA